MLLPTNKILLLLSLIALISLGEARRVRRQAETEEEEATESGYSGQSTTIAPESAGKRQALCEVKHATLDYILFGTSTIIFVGFIAVSMFALILHRKLKRMALIRMQENTVELKRVVLK